MFLCYRHLSSINTVCGFDSKFFEILKVFFDKKKENQVHGLLVWDEMSTRKSISVNTVNLTYKGLQDFGADGPKAANLTDKADHALVLLFQPLDDTYTQPIAVFASKGPVKGVVLTKLIIKAIILLEAAGAKVHGVVSDGANPNRNFWKQVGVSGNIKDPNNSFTHPLDDNRKIFVFSDVPHLYKCIRNRWEKTREFVVR